MSYSKSYQPLSPVSLRGDYTKGLKTVLCRVTRFGLLNLDEVLSYRVHKHVGVKPAVKPSQLIHELQRENLIKS